MGYKSFKDLEVYIKARELRNEIEDLSKTFPPEEKYKLVDQIIRSSRSVTANIAEGHGRYHFKEYIQSCRTSRGELLETVDHLSVAFDRQYIDENALEKYEERINEIEKMLNGYIKYLKKRLDDA